MKYNFEFAVSAQVSAKIVEEMVRKVVEEQTGKRIKKVDMKLSKVSKGFGPSESMETVFDGCTVYFENEATATGSKTFTQDSYDPTAR
jgi:hypothetical protein